MDISLLRDEEQFSFDSHSFLNQYLEQSGTIGDINDFSINDLYEWNADNEKLTNEDSSTTSITNNLSQHVNIEQLNTSPCREDFQKIMNEWQQFINLETSLDDTLTEQSIVTLGAGVNEKLQKEYTPLHETLNFPDASSFDLASYVNGDENLQSTQKVAARKPKVGVKKIDMKAQKYIIDDDEDEVDVETVSECGNSPVLEANDLNSLLEQFEATEMSDLLSGNTENLLTEVIENSVEKETSLPSSIEGQSKDMAKNENECGEQIAVKVDVLDVDINVKNINEEISRVIEDKFIEPSSVKSSLEINCDKQQISSNKEEITFEGEHVNTKRESNSKFSVRKKRKIETQSEVCKVKNKTKHVIVQMKRKRQDQVKCSIKHIPNSKPDTHETPTPEIFSEKEQSTQKICRLKNECHQSTTEPQNVLTTIKQISHDSTTSFTPDQTKNKQIIDALPQELIARIKESGKRKTISVIPPIPSKKRGAARIQEATTTQPCTEKLLKCNSSETVKLDHSYCSQVIPYPKHPKKDSGFESAEEDDRTVIRKQPMVKNADGTLMVSLLKANTICENEPRTKKILNIEEYFKRRREGRTQSSSQNCSPASSTCSSPMPEDENLRRIKHQEKLMKMALGVLNTPPKSEKKPELPPVVTPIQPLKVPADMEKKTLVSIGCNTEFKICRNIDPLVPVEQLEKIKPLLKKASAKIHSNSLITSLIENIPKVINNSDIQATATDKQDGKLEHGEDKTIVYLPKNRAVAETKSIECQTNISLIPQVKQSGCRRRRNSSSSTSSSSSSESRRSRSPSPYRRKRNNSNTSSGSSCSSYSSRSGSTSPLSSRSSSLSKRSSPKRSRQERERLREVEERRVIYVGRISSTTTRDDLRKRFQRFGPIKNVSLHFRTHGDNYGFVTFANNLDAYQAKEHGNDDPLYPKYDICFGGRRIFCRTSYSDLDNVRDDTNYYPPRVAENSFDTLLREAQEKLRKRKA